MREAARAGRARQEGDRERVHAEVEQRAAAPLVGGELAPRRHALEGAHLEVLQRPDRAGPFEQARPRPGRRRGSRRRAAARRGVPRQRRCRPPRPAWGTAASRAARRRRRRAWRARAARAGPVACRRRRRRARRELLERAGTGAQLRRSLGRAFRAARGDGDERQPQRARRPGVGEGDAPGAAQRDESARRRGGHVRSRPARRRPGRTSSTSCWPDDDVGEAPPLAPGEQPLRPSAPVEPISANGDSVDQRRPARRARRRGRRSPPPGRR